MRRKQPEAIGVEMDELAVIVEAARRGALNEEQYKKLKAAIDTLGYVADRLEGQRLSIQQLKELLFGKSTEKASQILPTQDPPPPLADASNGDFGRRTSEKDDTNEPKEKKPGHGRNGASAYTGADRVCVEHGTLKPRDLCPECRKGKVTLKEPARLIRITGHAPVHATVYELERLRCALCGEVFTAEVPHGVGDAKYDASAAAMIGLLKYGSGQPFYRLEGLQRDVGIPLPASTQWEIVAEAAESLIPVFRQLIVEAAQGEVVHNDDTNAKILALAKQRAASEEPSAKRKGIFTTGIVALQPEGRRVALFFTGRQHAGENLERVLKQRALGLPPPIQMCDALSRNLPNEYEVILSHCLAHARRKFVKVVEAFPDECKHVVLELGKVYCNDQRAKELGVSKEERLSFHQEHSKKVMDELRSWLDERLDAKLVEPSSGLGAAIQYMTKHWDRLTRFLEVAGAPLDNNICERALKKAILHRKNSLFFKTERGAEVGDVYLSLIHTAELTEVNVLEYLTALLRNGAAVAEEPARWLPWNYGETLATIENGTLPT